MSKFVEITAPFIDRETGERRTPDEGIIEVDDDRAETMVSKNVGRIVEKKAKQGPPEDKSLSGPPENKKKQSLEKLTVDELTELAEANDINLPAGYIKKQELVSILREEM